MVVIRNTLNKFGKPIKFYINPTLAKELDKAKTRVLKKNWDYVCLVCGLPGSGKSTFARTIAKFLCPWFNLDYIAFTASQFEKITTSCPEFSAVILDESFASFNTKITMTPDYIKVVNHLQLIRKRHLFMILCIPNFFDLSKSIAIFRSSHLFMTFANDAGDRGNVKAYGREEKRIMYVKGNRYLDYSCVHENFTADFIKNKQIIDESEYEKMKDEHLKAMSEKEVRKRALKYNRDEVIYRLRAEFGFKIKQLCDIFKMSGSSISEIIKNKEEMAKSD